MGGGGTDFVPGTDLVPGSDFVPGVSDVLGVDIGPDVLFGGDAPAAISGDIGSTTGVATDIGPNMGQVIPPDVAPTSVYTPVDTTLSPYGSGAGAAVEYTTPAVADTAATTAATNAVNQQAILDAAKTAALKGAAMGAGTSLISGGNPITGALTGAVSGGVGGAAGNLANQYGLGTIGSGVIGGAAGTGTGALLNGGNVGAGLLSGGLSGGLSSGINELTGTTAGSALAPLTNAVVSSLVNGTPISTGGYTPTGGTTSTGGTTATNGTTSFSPFGYQNPFGNLVAGTSKGSQVSLPGETSFTPQVYNADVAVPTYAEGSSVDSTDASQAPAVNAPNENAFHTYSGPYNRQLGSLKGQTAHGSHTASLLPPTPSFVALPHLADGGHVPEFYSEGGLKHTYVQGDGDGTSDSVPAMLANGEFVIPADVVSSLGNGSNDSGSKVLDEFLETIRAHKQEHKPSQLPPDSKGALAYLEIAHKKAGK